MAVLLPSIFASDFSDVKSALQQCNEVGIQKIHYDVMDNHFVPNISFGLQFTEQVIKASTQKADIHLMISPITYKEYLDLNPEVLTIHVETDGDVKAILRDIRSKGVKAGISLKPATPVEVLKDLEGEFDLLLIMSVEPGFSFQSFIPESLDKIREARKLFGSNIIIEADGGIKRSNMHALKDAGLDWFVMGGGFFKDPDQKTLMEEFNKLS